VSLVSKVVTGGLVVGSTATFRLLLPVALAMWLKDQNTWYVSQSSGYHRSSQVTWLVVPVDSSHSGDPSTYRCSLSDHQKWSVMASDGVAALAFDLCVGSQDIDWSPKCHLAASANNISANSHVTTFRRTKPQWKHGIGVIQYLVADRLVVAWAVLGTAPNIY
jgi:hypothetical protein